VSSHAVQLATTAPAAGVQLPAHARFHPAEHEPPDGKQRLKREAKAESAPQCAEWVGMLLKDLSHRTSLERLPVGGHRCPQSTHLH
jgi:hypothetical protein